MESTCLENTLNCSAAIGFISTGLGVTLAISSLVYRYADSWQEYDNTLNKPKIVLLPVKSLLPSTLSVINNWYKYSTGNFSKVAIIGSTVTVISLGGLSIVRK
jgi:hypothetical protein